MKKACEETLGQLPLPDCLQSYTIMKPYFSRNYQYHLLCYANSALKENDSKFCWSWGLYPWASLPSSCLSSFLPSFCGDSENFMVLLEIGLRFPLVTQTSFYQPSLQSIIKWYIFKSILQNLFFLLNTKLRVRCC